MVQRHVALAVAGFVLLGAVAGCNSPIPVSDPIATLQNTESHSREMLGAMVQLDAEPASPEYIQILRRIQHRPGYTLEIREAAFNRLERVDPEALKDTLRLNLPGLEMLEWRRTLCRMIADRGWTDMSSTLVRAWSYPIPGWVPRDEDRPERQALERLHGRDALPDYLFQTVVEADPVRERNLRARCWEMLHRLGQRERLVALMKNAEINPTDSTLTELRAAAAQLGVVPFNLEEILWVLKLREPSRAEFWSEATQVFRTMPEGLRATMEIRDIAVAVAASRHRPELLTMTKEDLYTQAVSALKGRKFHAASFEGWEGAFPSHLQDWRSQLTWGDLVAVHLAIQALDVPQFVNHVFSYADRDQKDTTTEYGGIVRLDDKGRFELVEFQPRSRISDERFEATQEMLDAAYTSLFHFHNHTMRHDNERYAGPHMGDFAYADNTRANCLVFTFIKRDTLNVDFYRHGRVVVDLGDIHRP